MEKEYLRKMIKSREYAKVASWLVIAVIGIFVGGTILGLLFKQMNKQMIYVGTIIVALFVLSYKYGTLTKQTRVLNEYLDTLDESGILNNYRIYAKEGSNQITVFFEKESIIFVDRLVRAHLQDIKELDHFRKNRSYTYRFLYGDGKSFTTTISCNEQVDNEIINAVKKFNPKVELTS